MKIKQSLLFMKPYCVSILLVLQVCSNQSFAGKISGIKGAAVIQSAGGQKFVSKACEGPLRSMPPSSERQVFSLAESVSAVASGIDVSIRSLLLKAGERAGNFRIGRVTIDEAEMIGKAWVGQGYYRSKRGDVLISRDQLRQYRPPTLKHHIQKYQANLEWRKIIRDSNNHGGKWIGNAHLDILN